MDSAYRLHPPNKSIYSLHRYATIIDKNEAKNYRYHNIHFFVAFPPKPILADDENLTEVFARVVTCTTALGNRLKAQNHSRCLGHSSTGACEVDAMPAHAMMASAKRRRREQLLEER